MKDDTSAHQWHTRYSLLNRAKGSGDAEAWKELVGIYQRFVMQLLCRLGVAVSAREDLVQEVIIEMWKGLDNYDSGRALFRTWLRAVTRNTAITYFRKTKHIQTYSMDDEQAFHRLELLTNPELDAIIEDEWKAHITELAFERVRGVFSGKAMEVFLLSMEDVEVKEIARRHRLSTDSVYTLRNRVKTRLVREVRELIDKLEFRAI